MSTKQLLQTDMTTAMKAGDKARVSTIRMLRARIQEAEIAAGELDEARIAEVIARYAKQLREAIEGYAQGGREEQKKVAEAELTVVESYLPKQLGADEITRLVDEAVQESGAQGPKEMGKVMSLVMPKVKGRADGKLVNQIVRDRLGKG